MQLLVYLFVPNQLYMFRAMFSPSIRSTWLYLQLLILSTYVAASRCYGRDRTTFHLVHDTGRQKHRWTISEAVNTVKCSWWWKKTSPETCRANWVQINEPKICILLVSNYELRHRNTGSTIRNSFTARSKICHVTDFHETYACRTSGCKELPYRIS